MEKSRNYVVFGVLALVVSLVAVSLAYAGFTQTLNINGTASIKTANWNVHFANVANKTLSTGASWGTQPALDGATKIGDYSVTFTTPGQSASFEFDVENTGSFAAKLTSLTVGTPTCSGDNSFTCSQITYVLTEKGSSTPITAADSSVLDAYTGKKTYVLTLTYVDSGNSTNLPSSDVSISGLAVQFTYTQEGNYVAPSNG
jgi:hypothetical protein